MKSGNEKLKLRKIYFIKYFLIITTIIVIGCSASSFVSDRQKIQGKWEEIIPKGSFFLGGNLYTYIFDADSFYVTETFSGDVMPYRKSIDKGSGTYNLTNNKIFFKGFYILSYIHKTDYLYHVDGDSMWAEVVLDTVYNFKEIKEVINEEHFYRFKGDTLILDCDKKYTKKYFVRE